MSKINHLASKLLGQPSNIGAKAASKSNSGPLQTPSSNPLRLPSTPSSSASSITAKPKRHRLTPFLKQFSRRKSPDTSHIQIPSDALDENASKTITRSSEQLMQSEFKTEGAPANDGSLLPRVDIIHASPPTNEGTADNLLDMPKERNPDILDSLLHAPADRAIPLHNVNESEAGVGEEELSPNLVALMEKNRPRNLTGEVVIDYKLYVAGGRALVFVGMVNDEKVAVKVLMHKRTRRHDALWEVSNERRVKREIDVWAALKHPNICEFIGYATDHSDYASMILKWCPYNAAEFLYYHQVSIEDRLRMTQDVSKGLQYLHELKVVHGDLKPINILVDEQNVAKLCDFGLVRLVDWEGPPGYTSTSAYTGTSRYKAPELFSDPQRRGWKPVATFEGDVYSLGCIMLDFIEQQIPFSTYMKDDEALLQAIQDYNPPAKRSESKQVLLGSTEFFWNLLETCWSEASSRPAIKDIIDALESYAKNMPTILS